MAMDNADILAALDEQIRTLQKVKALLEGKPSRTARALKKAGGRVLSDEARAKIAAAQKARWARVKKAKK
jgi:DNA polymerase III delta subunit